jgi:hypothetical protein
VRPAATAAAISLAVHSFNGLACIEPAAPIHAKP